jgi:Na+-driven multidrug efflux pump
MVPIAWLLSTLTKNLSAVWFAVPIAECLSLTLAAVLFKRMAGTLSEPEKRLKPESV